MSSATDRLWTRGTATAVALLATLAMAGSTAAAPEPKGITPEIIKPPAPPADAGVGVAQLQTIEQLTGVADPERAGRIAGLMTYQRGLIRFVQAALSLPESRRLDMLRWGLQGAGREVAAAAFDEREPERLDAARLLGAMHDAEAGWLLGRLINDESRSVRLAAAGQVVDGPGHLVTRDTIDALWRQAIDLPIDGYPQPQQEPARFRGRDVPFDGYGQVYNNSIGEDAELIMEVLLEIKSPLIGEKLRQRIARSGGGRWGGGYFQDPNLRLQRLAFNCEPADVLPGLVAAATASSPGGTSTTTFNGRKWYWSNRTWAIGMVVKITSQSEEDYDLAATGRNMGGHGWAFETEADETKAIQKLKTWWAENERRYLKTAATQVSPAATAPATPPSATGPAPRYVRINPMDAETRTRRTAEALAAMVAPDFAARQAAEDQLRHVLRDRVEDALEDSGYQPSSKLTDVLDLDLALSRWTSYLVQRDADERARLMKWGHQGATIEALVKVFSDRPAVRARGALRLAKDPGPEASAILADLLTDPSRTVYLAAMEAVWNRTPTPRMIDLLWDRAVAAGLDRMYAQNQQVMLQFRGRLVQSWSPAATRTMADSTIATEVLAHWKPPEVGKKLVAMITDRASKQAEMGGYDNLWQQTRQYPPAMNFVTLLKACKPAGALQALAAAMPDRARNGYRNPIHLGGNAKPVEAWISERTQMLAVGAELLDLKPSELGIKAVNQYGNIVHYFPSEDDENTAVKLFKEAVKSGKHGPAATQGAAATRAAALRKAAATTGPATQAGEVAPPVAPQLRIRRRGARVIVPAEVIEQNQKD